VTIPELGGHEVTYALNLFGDPEMEIWTAEPDTLEVAFDHTNHTVTVTETDGVTPIANAHVVFTYSGGEEYYNTTTSAGGVATCGFEYQDVCVTKYGYFPVLKRIGGASETISSALELKWDMIIPSGHTMSLQNDLTLSSFGGRAARIIVEDGGTLNIAANATITGTECTFFTSEFWEVPGNGIEVYGSITIGNGVTFTGSDSEQTSPTWDGLYLNGCTVSCTADSFFCTPLKLEDYASFTGTDMAFNYSPIEVETSNLDLDDSRLLDSAVRGFYYDPGPFQNEQHVYITDSDISEVAEEPAIRLTNYPEFELSGNDICDNIIGCYIEESGIGDPGLIEDNTIEGNEMYGLVLYHSYADITGHNVIQGNMRGMVVYRYANWEMIGDNQYPLQRVRENDYDEIAFTYDSAPTGATFYYNEISDTDTGHAYPLMKCYDTPTGVIEVSNNAWGALFNPSLDLFPEGLYSYLPTWIPGIPRSDSLGAEALYILACQYYEDESYLMAKQTHEQVIEEYPASDYAKLSAEALLAIEKELGENYGQLQAYYQSICADSLDAQLYRVCSYLANYCNLEIEEYEDAITWFEDVIENAPTLTDSVYAVIDAGFVYLLMEEEEIGERSAFTGRIPELRPVSLRAYQSNKDELLAILWGDEPTSEQDIPAVLTVAQNYPNPFNPTTTIKFSIPAESNVKLTVYNIRGQRVATLVDDTLTPGYHTAVWNGRDSTGRNVASGVYFYRLKAGGKTITKKMLLLK